MYTTDSYSTESYEFLDSPSEVAHPSSSSITGSSFNEHGASFYPRRAGSVSSFTTQNPSSTSMSTRLHDAYRTNIDSDYLESQSPDAVSFDDDKMRLKLQELERALLEDNDDEHDEEMIGSGQSMEIDGEWTEPIQNALLHDSPKESSSSDSYLSSISSNKEISGTSLRTPKQLLFDCASALSEGNIEEASTMINELRQLVSIQGDPHQRIAAYMVEGLAARMASSGKFLYRALKCKEPPSSYRLAAMQVLFEVCPCFKFGFMAANGAIIEATKDDKRVHIIDFDINQGNQYITLIQTLAQLPGKPLHLRLTGIDDPESVQRPVGGLNTIGQRLEQLAEGLGVSFEFQAVASKTSIVSPSMLDCRPGEALVVNFAFQLHHMPDESVSTVNQRDQLLRLAKSLRPKLVTVVEQDVNTNTTPFFPRFVEAYNYYSAVFDSLEAAIPRESQDRMNVEKQCLARDIVNIVACEGEERIERYKIKEEMGALHFGWEDKTLIVASAWR
ncbi:hypothetical protein ACLB2K_011280 [Fragaria x ananassa]